MLKRYSIKEIFGPTIQGEGSWSGSAVLFLRFAGCNKWSGLEKDKPKSICSFCDTDFRNGTLETKEEIINRLKALKGNVKTLVISGGEPLLQLDKDLCDHLIKNGFFLQIETNGSLKLGEMSDYIEHVSVSPKQSAAKTLIERIDDLKFLFPFLDGINPEEFTKYKQRYLQPIKDDNYNENVSGAIDYIYKNPETKLSLQLHKIIGVL